MVQMYSNTDMNYKQRVTQTVCSGASGVSDDHSILTDIPTGTLGLAGTRLRGWEMSHPTKWHPNNTGFLQVIIQFGNKPSFDERSEIVLRLHKEEG